MVPTTVGIIGAGIAGPVLAMFLKQKGYNPVVYERSKDASTGGLSLWYALFVSRPLQATEAPTLVSSQMD